MAKGVPLPTLASILEANDEVKRIQSSRHATKSVAGCQCKAVKTDKQGVVKLKADLNSFLQYYRTKHSSDSGSGEIESPVPGVVVGDEGQEKDVRNLFMLSVEDINKMSRTELLQGLKVVYRIRKSISDNDIVGGWYYNQCSVCLVNECDCVIQGIECDSAVCGCMAVPTDTGSWNTPTFGLTGLCRNVLGRRSYRGEVVRQHRQAIIKAREGEQEIPDSGIKHQQ